MELTVRKPQEDLAATYGDATLAEELKLEARMCSMGQRQIRKQIEKAREKGSESGTGYGKSLLARSVDRVAENIDSFKAKAKQGAGRRHLAVKYLDQLDSDIAAYIALRLVIDSLTGRRKMLQRVAIQIGVRIADEVRFAAFAESNRSAYNAGLRRAKKGTTYQRKTATMAGFERRFSEEQWEPWPDTDCLHVGMVLIDIIVAIDLVQIGTEVRGKKNTVKVLEPTATIAQWIEREAERSELLAPALLPMLCKPLPYTDPFNGGYLTAEANGRNTVVKVSNANYLTEMADNAEQMPMIYDAVNALQDTGWRINRRVHEVLETMWEAGHALAKLPSRDDHSHCKCPQCGELIELPKLNTRGGIDHGCFEAEEVLRQWKSDAHVTHTSNVSLRSKRMSVSKTLYIADIYKDTEAFYFPYQLDFRGRVYAVPSFNPQGNDVTKGLLQFSEGMAIEDGVGAGWLAIHGANVFGYDKASLVDRIQWVEDHVDEIEACAVDPFGCRFWHGADKPWQFLAFCLEWTDFRETGYGYVSRMAVALDGSCSGIQHFSAMLRDEVGGDAVNLIPADTPSDIYQKVCDRVVEKLQRDAGQLSSTIDPSYSFPPPPPQEGKEAEAITIATETEVMDVVNNDVVYLATAWLKLQPNRKTTKRQVMTLPYGATEYSCREYTAEWLRDQVAAGHENPFSKDEVFTATQYMAGLIWQSIGEVVIAARAAMDWLQKCAKVVAAEELPVYWTTPVGFTVMQDYKNTAQRRVKTKLGDSVVKLTVSDEMDTINKRRMQNAISPNFVHSMDATHLVMSVAYAHDNGIPSFAMIHDSFGTHAANTNLLAACLREAFVDLYSDLDVLEDFRDQILRQVAPEDQDKIPPVPSRGGLDIEAVRASDFFFA